MQMKTCKYCGLRFAAKTKRAEYCSDKCRIYASRRRAATLRADVDVETAMAAPRRVKLTAQDVANAVLAYKSSVAELDACSVKGPRDTRELCRHLSTAALVALKEVGL